MQTVFSAGKLTQKLCLNCHKVKSKREDPVMKLQGEFLPDSDSGGGKTLPEVVVAGLVGVSTELYQYSTCEDDPQHYEEQRDSLYGK